MARYGRAKYSSNEPKAKEVKMQNCTAIFTNSINRYREEVTNVTVYSDALEYLDGSNYMINEFHEKSDAKAWAQAIDREAGSLKRFYERKAARIEETLAFYESEH